MVLIGTAVAASLFLRPSRRGSELFATFAPMLAAAFWGYAWFSWYPGPYTIRGLTVGLQIVLGAASIGAVAFVWRLWGRKGRGQVGVWVPIVATVSVAAVFSTLFITKQMSIGTVCPLLLVALVPLSIVIGAVVPWIVARRRLPPGERPGYLGILRPALATCLVWILALQFASLVWLGAWRIKAAHEIERARAVNENQAVLRIMGEMHHEPETE
jgi:hypothetical protein